MTAGTEAALGVVRAVMEVAGSPEKVFRALTDPKELEQWWGSDDVYSDIRVGERSQARRAAELSGADAGPRGAVHGEG